MIAHRPWPQRVFLVGCLALASMGSDCLIDSGDGKSGTGEGDTDTDSDADSDTDADTDADCNANTTRVLLGSGGNAQFESWVYNSNGSAVVVVGLQTAGSDGCAAMADLTSLAGYYFEMEMIGVPSAGDSYSMTSDAGSSGDAEIYMENLGTSDVEESQDGVGELTVDSYGATSTMSVSDFEFTLDGGSSLTAGEFTACYCADVPVE